jgi:hypothetical protein
MNQKLAYVSFLLLLLLVWTATPAHAQEAPPDGPAFLVISLDATNFDTTGIKAKGAQAGSTTITVMIGTFSSGGDGPQSTVFTLDELVTVPLPLDKNGNPIDITTLDGHDATIFGSFEAYNLTTGALEPHVITTTSATIDSEIQQAVVDAAGDLQTAIAGDPFMTTGEIANIVYKKMPKGTSATLSDVASAMFNTDNSLDATTDPSGDPLVESEGDLLPHAPGSAGLFHYTFSFDKDGDLSADYVRYVKLSVSENSVDLSKQGVLPVVVLSDAGFYAGDVSWVKLNGVEPSSSSLSDANGDGISDLLVKFDVPELVKHGLSTTNKTVTLTGEVDDGTHTYKIYGTATVNAK